MCIIKNMRLKNKSNFHLENKSQTNIYLIFLI